ncbi:MAG: 23S rRNA (guanosine2251-2'-O)-methyltransferase [Cellvibrionaceae bacterium]|jgi:23S rRNA (guanosine2251-2'-O)-methyltransferase
MCATSPQLIYGFHSVGAALRQNADFIEEIFLLRDRKDQRLQTLINLAEEKEILIHWCDRKQLDDMVSEKHQGVVARQQAETARVYHESFLKSRLAQLLDKEQTPFLLILDNVTDPHNLGACLRSADAAGVHLVIAPKDNSAPLSPTAIKVACGAAEAIPLVHVTNLSRTMRYLQQQGVWILGADGEAGERYDQVDMTGPLAIVMGSEGKGLRRLTRESCDILIAIPMIGSVSSLNVSVATGVCLFEARRQRQ